MITSKYQHSALWNSNISWPAVKCLSFAKLHSGPHKMAKLFSLLPSVRRKLLLSWIEGRGVAAQFSELSSSLYAFFPTLAHHIWVVWRTGAVVPVLCINRSKVSQVVLQHEKFCWDHWHWVLWQQYDHTPGSLPCGRGVCHRLNCLNSA